MEVEVVIMIIFGIIALLALIAAIIGIILIENRFSDSRKWWVQLMIWGGFIIFLLSIILIAFMGISLKLKKSKRKTMPRMYPQDDYLYYEQSSYGQPQPRYVMEQPRYVMEQPRQRYVEDVRVNGDTMRTGMVRTNGNGNVVRFNGNVRPNGDVKTSNERFREMYSTE